ncbi:unnamed protein product, partial [Brassica rapa subsp. trilocularis]
KINQSYAFNLPRQLTPFANTDFHNCIVTIVSSSNVVL